MSVSAWIFFSGVSGAIDCTHVWISRPKRRPGELFRNRKGYFSINVQVVGDAELRVRHIVARWPGSTHDARIFNESNVRDHFELNPGNGMLLGDSAYPLLPYLITPLHAPNDETQRRFNRAHCSTRVLVRDCSRRYVYIYTCTSF